MRADDKAYQLNIAAKKYCYSIDASPYKRNVLFPLFLFSKIIKNRRPDAVIVRYLNDTQSLLRSFFSMLSVFVVIFTSKLFRIKIIWLLHNVDKETNENYPNLIKAKRMVVGKFASMIFVTDPLLVTVATKKYPGWKDKIDYITFGLRSRNSKTDSKFFNKKLIDFMRKNSAKRVLIGFCPTSAGDKCIHIHNAAQLIEKANAVNVEVRLVICGDLSAYLRANPRLKEELNHEQIYLVDEYVQYNPLDISPYIDFYWRSLSDESVSYTLYEAATIKKPILTLSYGFMGRAVAYYKLGAVLNKHMGNMESTLDELTNWDEQAAHSFLESHTWDNAARKIRKHL